VFEVDGMVYLPYGTIMVIRRSLVIIIMVKNMVSGLIGIRLGLKQKL
jgi:hypothetical protein